MGAYVYVPKDSINKQTSKQTDQRTLQTVCFPLAPVKEMRLESANATPRRTYATFKRRSVFAFCHGTRVRGRKDAADRETKLWGCAKIEFFFGTPNLPNAYGTYPISF